MVKQKKENFPYLSQSKFERLLKDLQKSVPEFVELDGEINGKDFALSIFGKSKESFDPFGISEMVDDRLGNYLGICFNEPKSLGEDGNMKSYTLKFRGREYILNGDNCYNGPLGEGQFYHRALLTWRESVKEEKTR